MAHLHPESTAATAAGAAHPTTARLGELLSRSATAGSSAGAKQRVNLVGDNMKDLDAYLVSTIRKQLGEAKPLQRGLSLREQQQVREQLLWDNDHLELRKQMIEWCCRPETIDAMRVDMARIGQVMDEHVPKSHASAALLMKQNFLQGDDVLKDPLKVFAFLESIVASDPNVNLKMGVHHSLYVPSVALLGTERHAKYLKGHDNIDNIGCFMMSEIGHASDVRSIGTTATYDKSTDSFVLNTPTEEDQKAWIGNLAYSAKRGVVFARLIHDGKDKGVHCFLCPLRDEKTHELFPGVYTKHLGLKAMFHGMDNGRGWFKNYRIPRENLLNKYADVTETGEYKTSIKSEKLLFAKHMGAMLLARVGVGLSGVSLGKLGISIAMRYAFLRKQFGPKPGVDVPIIYYQYHRNTIMPLLSRLYAWAYFENTVKKRMAAVTDRDLKEVHLLASAAKANISWGALRLLDLCRELCGGQGYLQRNGLCLWRAGADSLVTLDGANPVLYQQIAQVLLFQYGKQFKSKNIIGKLIAIWKEKAEQFGRNGMLRASLSTDESHLRSAEFILGALTYRTNHHLQTLAKRLMVSVDKLGEFDGFNDCQQHSIDLARAYCEMAIAENFERTIQRMQQQLGYESDTVKVHKLMFALYGLKAMSEDAFFVEKSAVSAKKAKAIREQVELLSTELVPCALSLVNAFGIPEFVFDTTIASNKYTVGELMALNSPHELF